MKNWKSIVYLVCAIQVGAGISMVGVMSSPFSCRSWD